MNMNDTFHISAFFTVYSVFATVDCRDIDTPSLRYAWQPQQLTQDKTSLNYDYCSLILV